MGQHLFPYLQDSQLQVNPPIPTKIAISEKTNNPANVKFFKALTLSFISPKSAENMSS